ncbi:MAG: glycosyltransferase family 2 protein [Fibrobacterota bacterium]|nr:MAG: glycosyltransferase family 2 protein [Fibrobacterota bacterium]
MRLIACLIARDEQENLPRCLRSLAGVVDGICLVDTGSTDSTVAIARSFGAEVKSIPWEDDFAKARNASLDMAQGDWVLQVDADEELDPRSVAALRQALSNQALCHLVEVELRDGTSQPGKVLLPRLFRLDPRIRYRRALHESVLESLDELGSPPPSALDIRLIHHGYTPESVASRSKLDRNLRILRKVRDRGQADAYDLYKLATTLPAWGESSQERSDRLAEAWSRSLEASPGLRLQWPWWKTLARSHALDLAHRGRFTEGWSVLEQARFAGASTELESARASLLMRAGHHQLAMERIQVALSLPASSGLAATHGSQKASSLHLAAQCALACGLDPDSYLHEASALGSLEARCDLAVRQIKRNLNSGWKELDQMMRTSPNHPLVLLAGSEAALAHGDRSTSDLLLSQAVRTPSEAAERGKARQWMRAWLDGATPTFDLAPSDAENAAAQGLDRVRRGLDWKPDPFLEPRFLRSCLADFLEALLQAGHTQVVRAFASHAKTRDAALPGISTLVLED